MFWADVAYNGKIEIDSRLKNTNYLKLIEEQIQDCATRIAGENFIFQHDNLFNTAKIIKDFFNTRNIPTLDWLAMSLDFNIIENVWGKFSNI